MRAFVLTNFFIIILIKGIDKIKAFVLSVNFVISKYSDYVWNSKKKKIKKETLQKKVNFEYIWMSLRI